MHSTSNAATKLSTGNGNWNTSGTWSPSGVPGAGDSVVIRSGHLVTVNTNAVCGVINVIGHLKLDGTSNRTFTTSTASGHNGNIRMTSTGIISGYGNPATGQKILIAGSFFSTGNTNSNAPGIYELSWEFYGTGAQTYSHSDDFGKLIINSSTLNLKATSSVLASSDVNVVAGTLDLSTFTLNAWVGSPRAFTVAAGATLRLAGTTGGQAGSNFPVNFNSINLNSNSTVEYYGDNQTIFNASYGNLNISGTSGAVIKTMPAGAMIIAGNFVSDVGSASSVSYTAGAAITFGGDVTVGPATIFSAGVFSHSVAGNWANNGTFSHGNGTISFASSGIKNIGGSSVTGFNNLILDNISGVNLTSNISINGSASALTLTNGRINTEGNVITLAASSTISGANSSKYINGNLAWNFTTGAQSKTFPVGTSSAYTPVDINFANVTSAGLLQISSANGEHPDVANSGLNPLSNINRYWTASASGLLFSTATATFTWVGGDMDGGASFAGFIVGKYFSSAWTNPSVASPLSTSIQATGLTSLGDFVVGNVVPAITGSTPASRCATGTVSLGATASTGIINWYSASTGGSSLGTGTSFTTPSISSTTIYYADASSNGYTSSPRIAITATVNNIPTITGSTPASRCGTGTVGLGANASAGTINWYAVSTGGASLGTGTSFTTPSISSTTIYYVDATANGCTTASRTAVTATVIIVPVAPTLGAANPASGTVICPGYNAGTVTATGGSGGGAGAVNEYQFSINGGSAYNSYTNGAAITTTGATGTIIIQSRRTGGTGCSNSAWSTIATWTVSTTPTAPTLDMATPSNGTNICVGTAVSATITAGTGGSAGAADTYEFSINNGSSWSAYTPGNSIATAGATTNVLIRTSRSAGSYGCSAAGNSTIVTWPVSQVPTTSNAGGNQVICLTTATFAANAPVTGTGLWSLISGSGTIVSPTSSTSNITGLGVGANVFRWTISNGACPSSASDVTITRDAATVGGTVSGSQTTCYNTQPASAFVVSGHTGTVIKWQRSETTDFSSVTDIANTTTTLTAAEVGLLTTTTYLRAVIKNGTCSQDFSGYATVTVNYQSQWNGSVNTNWSNAGNWSCGVPYPVTDAIIPAGVIRFPVISGATAVTNNLVVVPGASLSLQATLQVYGNITADSGSIKADSGALEMKGSLAQTIPARIFVLNNVRELIINNTAGVTIAGPVNIIDYLVINSGSVNTGGYITLRSSETNTAQIPPITSVAATPIVGNITVERFIPGRRKYRLITSSVNTSASNSLIAGQEAQSIWGNWQMSGSTMSQNVGTSITGGTAADGYDQLTTNASLFTYNDTASKFVAHSSANGKNTKLTPLKAGVGYYMFVYGDRQNSASATSPRATVLSAHGTVNTGSQSYDTTSAIPLSAVMNRFSLIGNPFPSIIDWKSVYKLGVSQTIWGWDPNLSSTGGYITVTATGGGAVVSPMSDMVKISRYIQPGQAFFIKTTGVAPQIIIRETDKAIDKNNGEAYVYRNDTLAGQPLLAVNLLYTASGNHFLADGVVAAFDDSFSNSVTDEDGSKMAGSTESIAWLNGNDLLAIDARKIPQNDILQLNTLRLTRSTYTLQIFTKDMQKMGLQIFLKDKFLQTETPLSLVDTNRIVFAITSDTASQSARRFSIIFKPNIVILPINFAVTKATRKENYVQVEWTVATVAGKQGYDIERSLEDNRFIKVGEVKNVANNYDPASYQWLDLSPATGNNYYRIRAVEANGAGAFSNVVKVNMTAINTQVKLTPNPVANKKFAIVVADLQKGVYTVNIKTVQGHTIYSETINHPGGSLNKEVIFRNKISPGLYYANFSGNGISTIKSLLVE